MIVRVTLLINIRCLWRPPPFHSFYFTLPQRVLRNHCYLEKKKHDIYVYAHR